MSRDLTGKTVLITGAAKGMGKAAANLFASAGANLFLADHDADKGHALAEELRRDGSNVVFRPCDVSRETDVIDVVQTAVTTFGKLDGALNNAGIKATFKRFHELEEAEFRRVIDTNLVGVFLMMKHQIRAMLETGGGSIVNAGSVAGVVGLEKHGDYNASKHGILGLMRNAVSEYSKNRIRVNTLVIGSVRTPLLAEIRPGYEDDKALLESLSPMGRVGEPEEIAQASLWLLSDRSSFVNGATLEIDGGVTAL
jgi:NAD(P)-dependent dehydrogenase (short-subunit alcohol dehydrogenase family)